VRPNDLGIGKLFWRIRDAVIVAEARSQRIILWNPTATKIFGYSTSEALELRIEALVPEHLKVQHRAGIARYAETGHGTYIDADVPLELPALRKSGEEIYVELSLSPIEPESEADGDERFVLAIVRDITERKRAGEALKENEERFRLLAQNVSDVISLVDEDGIVRYLSPSVKRVLDYEPEELVGTSSFPLIHPDDLDEAMKVFGEVRSAPRTTRSAEVRVKHKDGSWCLVEVSGTNLLAEASVQGIVTNFRDVSERRRATEALRESEERFRSLIQNSSDIITILKADGSIRYESPSVERVLGYHPEERIGKKTFDYVHPEDKGWVESTFTEALDDPGKVQRPVEFRLRHKDGSWRHMETIRVNLLRDPAVKGVVSNSRDITERKHSEEKLQSSLDALVTIHEAGQTFGATLNEDEIARSLLKMAQHVVGLGAAAIHLHYEHQEGHPWHAAGAERLWRTTHGSSEARAARDEVLKTGEHRLFEAPHPDLERGRLVGLCLPLRGQERVLGTLEAYGPETLKEQATVELLGSLANQAASALENARLYGELGERERRLQDLVGKLMAAQEEERRRVAYEVHDGLAQVAMGAHQQLQAFFHDPDPDSAKARRRLDRALELVEQTTEEARRVIADLRPTTLDDFGLTAAVRAQAEELRAEGWEVSYDEALGEERLPAEIETALYRVAREALWNVRKHAETTRVDIALDGQAGKVHFEVRDFGRGFDTSVVSGGGGPGERVGLSSMRERIVLLGGDFEIRSRPGEGTTVVAEVPLPAPDGGDTGYAG
jgi:PAS domain S-box-containing protein